MFHLQFYEGDDIIVYNGAITFFKNISSMLNMLEDEPEGFDLRLATISEQEAYKKLHNESN